MCTFKTDKIYLTWRKNPSSKRHIVGVLLKTSSDYTFEYLTDNISAANADGFEDYPAFKDLNKSHTNALQVFERRLPNPQRRDYDDFLKYWCAQDYKENNFAILGLTGAKLQTDSFEFIAPHYEIPAIFYTSVTWLNSASAPGLNEKFKHIDVVKNEVTVDLVPEPTNQHDKDAIKVIFEKLHVGYIKSIQCTCLAEAIRNKHKVTGQIKNVIRNGSLKEVLLRIEIK